MALPVRPVQGSRHEETFPTLTAREMERLRRYGTPHKFADGEKLFQTGKRVPGAFLVLSGVVAVSERDGLGHSTPIVEEESGNSSAKSVCFRETLRWSTQRPRVKSRRCSYPRTSFGPC